jgi:hypothetical protein
LRKFLLPIPEYMWLYCTQSTHFTNSEISFPWDGWKFSIMIWI